MIQTQLATAKYLYNQGHLRKCYHFLKDASMDCVIDEAIQLTLLRSNVALKLSLLVQAKKLIEQAFALLGRYEVRDNQYYKYLLDVGLILQKIEYWFCRYSDSVKVSQLMLQLLETHLPTALNERCEVLSQMANTYRAWCHYQLAQKSIDEAFSIQEKNVIDPLTVSNVLFVKARQSMDTDGSAQGIELANRCIAIRVAYYEHINMNHIDIALAWELLGKLHFSLGQTAEAEKYHNQAYECKMNVLGLYNFETIDSINERGRIMLAKKRDEDAKGYFTQLGVISLDLLGPLNQYEALSFNNLGCVCYNQRNFEEAIAYHQKALVLYQQLCGLNHYKLVFALNQMAYAHKSLGKHHTAIQLWKQCVNILTQVVGPPTERNIKTMLQQINLCYDQIEE